MMNNKYLQRQIIVNNVTKMPLKNEPMINMKKPIEDKINQGNNKNRCS